MCSSTGIGRLPCSKHVGYAAQKNSSEREPDPEDCDEGGDKREPACGGRQKIGVVAGKTDQHAGADGAEGCRALRTRASNKAKTGSNEASRNAIHANAAHGIWSRTTNQVSSRGRSPYQITSTAMKSM